MNRGRFFPVSLIAGFVSCVPIPIPSGLARDGVRSCLWIVTGLDHPTGNMFRGTGLRLDGDGEILIFVCTVMVRDSAGYFSRVVSVQSTVVLPTWLNRCR